jgi:hypothetical protein
MSDGILRTMALRSSTCTPGQSGRNAFQLPLTIICQFANYLNRPAPNFPLLVFKPLRERGNNARDGFTKLAFELLVSCAAICFNYD